MRFAFIFAALVLLTGFAAPRTALEQDTGPPEVQTAQATEFQQTAPLVTLDLDGNEFTLNGDDLYGENDSDDTFLDNSLTYAYLSTPLIPEDRGLRWYGNGSHIFSFNLSADTGQINYENPAAPANGHLYLRC